MKMGEKFSAHGWKSRLSLVRKINAYTITHGPSVYVFKRDKSNKNKFSKITFFSTAYLYFFRTYENMCRYKTCTSGASFLAKLHIFN